MTNWTLFPEEYRPKENSFLNDAIATDAARRLASDSTEDYMLGLDGEDLYIEDLSAIQKNFVQLYSFHYGFEYLDREAVQLKISSHANNWTGGMSSVWMFDGLSSVIPSVHRPRVAELRFNSPGHIKLNLLPELALEVQLSIDRITNPITFKLTEEFYNQVYKYFKSSGISGFESEQRNIRQKLTQEVKASLSGFVQRFLLLMAWPNGSKMLAELEESPLSQLRLLLAYYRRLRRLRGFVVDGRLDVGSSKLVAKEN
ncbi:hypothetical protein ACQCLI_20015 [Pseudomonas nitroreducens]|uniref:hypothetical protein n=1 Tax=Pseudomonas nitroreducens TaxID=46680 RepID=UPI0012FE7479|nr:hypothetical protein [Pseudomonas nitroreducens]